MPILAYLLARAAAGPRAKRDRKQRQAQRRMDRYKKCVAKKGADHKRCERILGRAEKSAAKAEMYESKLIAKGKTTGVARTKTGELAARTGATWAEVSSKKFLPSTPAEQMAASSDEYMVDGVVEESAGPSPVILVGGVLLLAGGGYAVWKMSQKPKKKKKKKVVVTGRSGPNAV